MASSDDIARLQRQANKGIINYPFVKDAGTPFYKIMAHVEILRDLGYRVSVQDTDMTGKHEGKVAVTINRWTGEIDKPRQVYRQLAM